MIRTEEQVKMLKESLTSKSIMDLLFMFLKFEQTEDRKIDYIGVSYICDEIENRIAKGGN